MIELANKINTLLLDNDKVKEYVYLKEELNNDDKIKDIRNKLDIIRKKECKENGLSDEYYSLLNVYESDLRVKRMKLLYKEINEVLIQISEILSF